MKILAGLIKDNDTRDLDGCFEQNGNFYDYQFEVVDDGPDTGFIRFSDSLGRMVPVDFDQLGDVAEMFARIYRFNRQREAVRKDLLDDLINGKTWLEDEIAEFTGDYPAS